MEEDKLDRETLQRTVEAKIEVERASLMLGAAIGNPKDKVCISYREQGIIHLSKAIELLNTDNESLKVITIRSLLKFDIIRSLRGLTKKDRKILLLNPKWLSYFNQLDPLSHECKCTTGDCLLAWNDAMDLLRPFIGKIGVELQKNKLDAILPAIVEKSKTRQAKKPVKTVKKKSLAKKKR